MKNAKLSINYSSDSHGVVSIKLKESLGYSIPIFRLVITETINNQGYEQHAINTYFARQTEIICDGNIITAFAKGFGEWVSEKQVSILIKKIEMIYIANNQEVLIELDVEVLPQKASEGEEE